MAKTIVITGGNEKLASAINANVGKFPELEVAFAMPYSEQMLENLSLAQPTFVICDLLKEEEFKNIIDICLDTTIVVISDDTNRAQSLISVFEKDGLGRFINLDMNRITPNGVLEQLNAYDPYASDDFFEEKSESEISKEVVDNPVQDTQIDEMNTNDTQPEDMPSDDIPVIEEKKQGEAISQDETYIPQDEPVAKPISEFKESVKRMDNNAEKINSAKIGAATQCQIVSVYSKKGGTGKTTVAKEIANIFSNISLPKKLSDKTNLDVCLLDFSFEQGDCRTMLGISNPNPNLYMFMDAIVSRLESGVPLEKIYFSAPEVKTNYCQDLTNGQFKLVCINQDDIPKKLADRILAFQDEELLAKILKKIIKTLRDTFNVIVIDMPVAYNDITELVLKLSSKIVYVLEPDLTSLDNLKSFLEKTKDRCYVTNKIIPLLNKDVKSQFKDTYITLYDEIRSQNPDLSECNAVAPYDAQISVTNNNYGFYTNNQSKFKQAMILVCSCILPVFKVKNISQDLKIVEAKRKADLKKKKLLAQKEATKKFNEEVKAKDLAKKESTKKAKKAKLFKGKENKIAELKNPEGNITQNEEQISQVENLSPQNNVEQTEAPVEGAITLKDYLTGDLSKVSTVEQFVEELKKCEGCKHTRKGFPLVQNKPKTIDKKVWKQYTKQLSKNLK